MSNAAVWSPTNGTNNYKLQSIFQMLKAVGQRPDGGYNPPHPSLAQVFRRMTCVYYAASL